MSTVFPMGFKEYNSVCTTNFNPGARQIILWLNIEIMDQDFKNTKNKNISNINPYYMNIMNLIARS